MTGQVTGPRLAAVTIAADDVDTAADFLATVLGSPALVDGERRRIIVDEAAIVVEPTTEGGGRGVVGIEIETLAGTAPQAPSHLKGLTVTTHPAPTTGDAPGSPGVPALVHVEAELAADVVLDHVAIVVADLDAAVARWESVIGAPGEMIGLHPVSAGTLTAARFPLGPQMLEMLAPVPGTTSAVRSRLDRVGEGAMALAVPAKDLEAKRAQLDDLGVRLLWQDPHWLVHPANPAGVLIQLTPRVKH